MFRLIRYLKPFTLFTILSIILLFVQGVTELSLPDYTGRIVNVGIQQGGVDTAVPEVLRESTMDRLALFLSTEDHAEVLSAYTRLTAESDPQVVENYPALADEALYRLNADVDGETVSRLDQVMGRGFAAIQGIEQLLENPEAAAHLSPDIDLSLLPEGVDLFALLPFMPQDAKDEMQASMDAQFEALGESTVLQLAVEKIKAEYTAIGLDVADFQNAYILRAGLVMLGISLLSVIAAVFVDLFSSLVGAGVARNLRCDVFKKVETFSNMEFDKFSISSLITRSTNDITQVQMLVMMTIRMVFYAPILGVGGIIKATNTDASMWWIIALGILALSGLIAVVFVVAVPKFRIIQDLVDRLTLVTRENLAGMLVVRAFNQQAVEEKRFDTVNQDVTATNLFISRILAGLMPIMMLILNGVTLLIMWVGASQVAASAIQVGDVLAFMQYGLQVMFAFLMLTVMFIILPRASVSANRIADVLETDLTIHDPAQAKTFPQPFTGTVEFRNVSFRYPGAEADVLSNLNFTAKPGQTTAFIGSTGSGKSTLINLIPRFYDVTEGAILVDGIDIREVTQHDLREQIGYVPQKALLFSGDVASNMRYAVEDASDEDIRHALSVAQADFVYAKPEGTTAEIAQGGGNVSGGQRQRLSIARALMKRAPIYIFDDSFSALDFKTDAALRKALRESTRESTLLIVTQRVSTVRHADQIVVLDQGEIVGKGTHDELMENNDVYREIVFSQMGKEDLAS